MITRQMKLSETQSETFTILYYSVKNAIQAAEVLNEDKDIPGTFRYDFLRIWSVQLNKMIDVLDKSFGANINFNEMSETDHMSLMEINRLFVSLPHEQQTSVEELFKALRNNEKIEVSVREENY